MSGVPFPSPKLPPPLFFGGGEGGQRTAPPPWARACAVPRAYQPLTTERRARPPHRTPPPPPPPQAVAQSLRDLRVDYLDLYLMHWPFAFAQRRLDFPLRLPDGSPHPDLVIREEYLDTWRAMQALVPAGRVRALGVCNFTEAQLAAVLALGGGPLAVHQFEAHPYLAQARLRGFCAERGIACMAYSPLGSGDSYSGASYPPGAPGVLLRHPAVGAVAERVRRSAAQVLGTSRVQLRGWGWGGGQ